MKAIALISSGITVIAAALWTLPAASAQPAAPAAATVITVSDEVVTPKILRFGINLGDDASYDASILTKERISDSGFEGIIYREATFGPGGDANSYFDWFGTGAWGDVIKGSTYWFVSGPRKGVKGKIVDVKQEVYAKRPDKKDPMPHYTFDKEGPAPGENDGMIIERVNDEQGYVGQHGGGYWVFTEGGATVKTAAGDVPPGSKGKVVCVLAAEKPATAPAADAKEPVAELMTACGNTKFMKVDGTWRLRFWAKGTGTLLVGLGDWNHRGKAAVLPQEVALTPEWKKQEITFAVENYGTAAGWTGGSFCLDLQLRGGTMKIDEISFQQEGDKNPTAFRDDIVDVLKKYRPGTLRALNMGGSSLDNILRPRETRMASSWSRRNAPPVGSDWPTHPNVNGGADLMSYSLPEFFQLCEEVGTIPWYCLPGAMSVEEMKNFMEYVGGPVTTPYGKLRADLGHPKPWTETLPGIDLEMGNEAWNYQCSGYSGPEYWNDLFTVVKESPYYKDTIRCNAGGQAVNVGRNEGVAKDTPQADAVNVGPYMIHEMSQKEAEVSEEDLWSWDFGFPWYHAHTGFMAQNYQQVTKKYGKELSIYEVNHHITGGDAPEGPRNKIVTSIGGGLNVANWMLMMLQEQKVRTQNLFSLFQLGYNANGKNVRLWGTALDAKAGEQRFRPTFQTCMLANQVLGGDLVTAAKTGADPKWTCKSVQTYDGKPNAPFDVPYIQAYATKDGKTRGLIVFNFHRTDALPVQLQIPGTVKAGSVTKWSLTADKIDDNNEPEHEEQVKVAEEKMDALASGAQMSLKPFSMTVLKWDEQ